jgi:hypothetical protein
MNLTALDLGSDRGADLTIALGLPNRDAGISLTPHAPRRRALLHDLPNHAQRCSRFGGERLMAFEFHGMRGHVRFGSLGFVLLTGGPVLHQLTKVFLHRFEGARTPAADGPLASTSGPLRPSQQAGQGGPPRCCEYVVIPGLLS